MAIVSRGDKHYVYLYNKKLKKTVMVGIQPSREEAEQFEVELKELTKSVKKTTITEALGRLNGEK